jgi:hypothetical protein
MPSIKEVGRVIELQHATTARGEEAARSHDRQEEMGDSFMRTSDSESCRMMLLALFCGLIAYRREEW